MSWTLLTTPPIWNVTDQELLKRLCYHLLENGNADASTLPSTAMFSQAQWLAAINQRQQMFLRDTAATVARATQASTPGTARYTLPSDWIHTRRVTWGYVGITPPRVERVKALARVDAYALDHGLSDWQQNEAEPT